MLEMKDFKIEWPMWAVFVLLVIIWIVLATAGHAQTSRKDFFEAVKDAQFFNGKTFNCCGPGDATRAKVIQSSHGMLAVQIIDPMRHPTAKAGEVYTVPQSLIVKKPMAPESLFPIDQKDGANVIFFLGTSADRALRNPFCVVQKQTGG